MTPWHADWLPEPLSEKVPGIASDRHYIGGEWTESSENQVLDGINPANEETWYRIAVGTAADVDSAVRVARETLLSSAWRGASQTQRGALLRRFGDLISDRVDEFSRIETMDNGKLLRETTRQIRRVPEFFYYYAGLADKIQGDVVPATRPDTLIYTLREPVGVVAAIVPWNSPLQLAAMKLAPALASGNTVIIKPSEHASASLLLAMPLFEEAGFPRGVVNLITGDGQTGALLTGHKGIDKIAFTGGTETGKQVAISAASHLARTTLELGGKNPQLVFADADVDSVVMGLLSGIFSAGGQTCVAGSRAFIHADLYDEICDRVATRAAAIRVGDPLLAETELGPLAIRQQLQKVEDFVTSAIADNATLRAGGRRPDEPQKGWFFLPTVFSDMRNDMEFVREEIFGPVLGIGRFEDDEQAVQLANDTPYGLAAGIWTKDLVRAHTVASRLDAGTVWVNTYRGLSPTAPFGGFKESGVGKENGILAIQEYTRVKSVWINLSTDPIGDPFMGR